MNSQFVYVNMSSVIMGIHVLVFKVVRIAARITSMLSEAPFFVIDINICT